VLQDALARSNSSNTSELESAKAQLEQTLQQLQQYKAEVTRLESELATLQQECSAQVHRILAVQLYTRNTSLMGYY
jgi:peptidoglycan hydrolase CwlO-like protein